MADWMVLPDRQEAQRVVTGWPAGCPCVLTHPSGNPFLVGSFDQEHLIVATVGSLRVAVIGSCPVTATELTELVAGVRTVRELDALARVLPGCWHLVASLDGTVRAQGSLGGVRRVFYVRIAGVAIVGGRADVLATLAGAGMDEQVLAVRVVCGAQLPSPVGERTFWQGVRALPPDYYLRLDPCGTIGEQRWWCPPEPQLSLRAGAAAVHQALAAAVAARRPTDGRLSADLSGGLDSTSLCFLAARAGMTDLLTFRWAEADRANDDAYFAAHAASQLPQFEHVVVAQAEMPSVFADPSDTGDTEAPYPFTRTLRRIRHDAALLVSHGARGHLAGHGGDELFQHGLLAYVPGLLRQRPLTAIHHVRGYRALYRWSWGATLSALGQRGDPRSWWYQQAQQLSSGPLPRRTPLVGWGYPLRAPAWVTPAALETTRAVLRATGDQAQPLAGDRGQHATLAVLRMNGLAYRQLSGVYATAGLRLELPYFDDRVIEAALTVPAHEANSPWRYKPLLVEAMRDVLPEAIAARGTKGESSEDVRVGLRQNRPQILEVFADSTLATHGLIDLQALRHELLTPQVDLTTMFAVEDLLGCETWLRATQRSASQGRTDAAAATC